MGKISCSQSVLLRNICPQVDGLAADNKNALPLRNHAGGHSSSVPMGDVQLGLVVNGSALGLLPLIIGSRGGYGA